MKNKIKNLKIKTNEYDERVAEIELTHVSYCQSCAKDFNAPELVYYAPIDNNLICSKCTEPHSNLELRLYLGRILND